MSPRESGVPTVADITSLLSGGSELTGQLVIQVADELQRRFSEVSGAMTAQILEQSDPLDQPDLLASLSASVEGNVETILQLLHHPEQVRHARPSTPAIEYAYRLAEHRVPSAALRRAYHLGSEALRQEAFAEVKRLDCSPDEKLNVLHYYDGFLHTYVDWMSDEVLTVHDQETRRLTEYSASATATKIRTVLEGGEVSAATFESTAHYRLTQRHRAAVVWIDRANPAVDNTTPLMSLVGRIARGSGASTPFLFTAVDRGAAWVWFAVNDGSDLYSILPEALATLPGARIAFGAPGDGVEGFRRSHHQALSTARVARISEAPRTMSLSYDDPGLAVASILTEDMAAVKKWVGEELGGLAAPTETAGRLRDTYLRFLDTGGSYTHTGAEMNLHRNTVKYRVEQALGRIGETRVEKRADVSMALHMCRILGTAALPEGG